MKKYLWLAALCGIFALIQCQPEDGPTPNVTDLNCTNNPDACELVNANNTFGFQIFKRLHQESPGDDIFISPLSISTALTMVLNGAGGQTKTDIRQTLEYDNLNIDQINQAYQYLLHTLPLLDQHVQLNFANSIWYEKSFPVKPPFLNTNSSYFDSEIKPSDFKDPATVDLINGWVKDKTNNKIDKILDEISADAVMYLLNAIYFKGQWRKQFDPDKTVVSDFYKADNTTIPVHMMNYGGKTKLNYFENDLVQAVDLPYGDSVFSMTLLLPKQDVSMDQVVNQLETGAFNNWTDQLVSGDVVLFLPRFKLEYEKVLNETLRQMGMDIAFDPSRADFTGIADANLFISLVKHKSFVEVNEEGTEAAAVTIVGFEVTSVQPVNYVEFNRPFLFVIRENQANGVLFIGKIMAPAE